KLPVQPMTPIVNPMAPFKSPYQQQLLELFRNGATLYVWRNASPHNWYLEYVDAAGVTQQVMVDADAATCLDSGAEQVRGLKAIACSLGGTGPVVQGGSAFENGRPQKEGWCFDPAKFQALKDQWDQTGVEYERRQSMPQNSTVDVTALSGRAL